MGFKMSEWERERGGYPRFHHGQLRRYSPSSEVRYYRGGVGVQAKCHHMGDMGEWSVVRPRRGKASEQVDGRRDRLREDQGSSSSDSLGLGFGLV